MEKNFQNHIMNFVAIQKAEKLSSNNNKSFRSTYVIDYKERRN